MLAAGRLGPVNTAAVSTEAGPGRMLSELQWLSLSV